MSDISLKRVLPSPEGSTWINQTPGKGVFLLRVIAHTSAAAAQKYYTEGLAREDYYSEQQEVVGKWYGKGAERLGLSGDVAREAFAALVENRHPATGDRLTARTSAGRRVGYDLNFHAPKSLSILHALTGDKALLEAFRSAVAETMTEIEGQAATRIRRGGADTERTTGNLVWAEFLHFTSRPVHGVADCHLHAHAFAMNCTFDEVENRWKAASLASIKQNAPYYQAGFHARLSEKVAALGFGVEWTKNGWEIAGVSRSLVDRFSRRGAAIDRLAEEKGITDPKAKDALGAKTRERKQGDVAYSEMVKEWKGRLTVEEKAQLAAVFARGSRQQRQTVSVAHAMNEATEKLFANDTVVRVNDLISQTLKFGVGRITPGMAWAEFGRREMVVREVDGQMLCTSIPVIAEEVSLINFVRNGRGKCAPLVPGKVGRTELTFSREEKNALQHLLKCHDQVMVLRGAAGVGKTTLMTEVARQIEAAGTKVYAFAQSSGATNNLRKAGLKAETVANLLVNTRLQQEVRGNVIFVDEAGLLGIRDSWNLLQIARNNTRVILVGDTAQHRPVARGDSLSLIEKFAGLKIAHVTRIRRQKVDAYKKAVSFLSRGKLQQAFKQLDELGAIVEIQDEGERYRALARDYIDVIRGHSVPIVVAPAHKEGAMVEAAIREALREDGLLERKERNYSRLQNLHWTAPDRRHAENYFEGLVVQLNQNVTGMVRGSRLEVVGRDVENGVMVTDAKGRQRRLPLEAAEHFTVYERRDIGLSRGDRIRITHNGKSDDGRRLYNGQSYTIDRFAAGGKIVLNTGAVLAKDAGHFSHDYYGTSYQVQSGDSRKVLVAQSAASFPASNKEQIYVTSSRGIYSISVYTDDRDALQAAVGNSSLRRSGIDLAGFSADDIAMNDTAGATKWQDTIKSRQTHGASEQHVSNLLRERKQEGQTKTGVVDFKEYVEIRRKLAGPDGKNLNRGKGSGFSPPAGKITVERSGPFPTEFYKANKEALAASAAAKPAQKPKPVAPEENRLKRAYAASKERFAKVTSKLRSSNKPEKTEKKFKMPKATPASMAKKRVKVDKAKKTKAKAKVAAKAPAPAPRR